MNKKYTPHKALAILLIFINLSLSAQDFHFSQFYNNPLALNPALTGSFIGDYRLNTVYKNQWASLGNAFTTFGGSADIRFKEDNAGKYLGGGIQFFNDEAGTTQLGLNYVALSGAYNTVLNSKWQLAAGLSVGFGQRSINIGSDLKWDNQFNGHFYVPGSSIGEVIGSQKKNYIDASVGGLLYYSSDKNYEGEMGLAIAHPHNPNQGFLENGNDRLLRKYILHTKWFLFFRNFDLEPQLMAANQGGALEVIAGSWIRYIAGMDSRFTNFSSSSEIQGGIFYRYNDAVILATRIGWKRRLFIGFS
ncbi:MAG: PorP/SprF family type IX secretion system membrane protein, partial [Flavobacteriales bacterium]|nr:PorP/SprF family type IX secretion system membrane protein [Flavobacteriales bacterium]